MIFKPRVPLPTQNPEAAIDPPVARPAQPTAATKASPIDRDPEDGEALVGAFDAVAQVVRREMETLRRSIVGLETQLVRRIEAEKSDLSSAMSALRQDMISRVDELRQHQQKALAEAAEQSKASIVALRGHLEQERQHASSRADEVKAGLEQILKAKEQKLEKELETLAQSLSGVRVDLAQQVATAGRVSAVLNDIAEVFADPQTLPKTPATPAR